MYDTITITMRPNSTIEALIRFHNGLSIDKQTLQQLVAEFNRLNPHALPPRPWQTVEMPVLKNKEKDLT